MAGRGRGKANLSFEIGSLGFGAGEALPTQTLQPPSTYPPLQQRPTPLSSTEVDEYLLALSQEYRGSIKDSMFFLKPNSVKKDITRYTDRYKQTNQKADSQQWEPDWRFFPQELKPNLKRKASVRNIPVNPKALKKRGEPTKEIEKVDVVKKLDELVQREVVEESGAVDNVDGENEGEEEVEEEYEEEFEDDNDYNFDYYDDGGDNYGDDDDREEGPVY